MNYLMMLDKTNYLKFYNSSVFTDYITRLPYGYHQDTKDKAKPTGLERFEYNGKQYSCEPMVYSPVDKDKDTQEKVGALQAILMLAKSHDETPHKLFIAWCGSHNNDHVRANCETTPGVNTFSNHQETILRDLDTYLQEKIDSTTNKQIDIILAGHSLGGALAELSVIAILKNWVNKSMRNIATSVSQESQGSPESQIDHASVQWVVRSIQYFIANSPGISNEKLNDFVKESDENNRRLANKCKISGYMLRVGEDYVQHHALPLMLRGSWDRGSRAIAWYKNYKEGTSVVWGAVLAVAAMKSKKLDEDEKFEQVGEAIIGCTAKRISDHTTRASDANVNLKDIVILDDDTDYNAKELKRYLNLDIANTSLQQVSTEQNDVVGATGQVQNAQSDAALDQDQQSTSQDKHNQTEQTWFGYLGTGIVTFGSNLATGIYNGYQCVSNGLTSVANEFKGANKRHWSCFYGRELNISEFLLRAKNQADTEISLSTSKLDWLENVIKKARKLLQPGDNNTSVRQKARSMLEQMNKLSSVGDKLLEKWTWTGWYGVNHLQSIKENDNETTKYWEENAKKPKSILHKIMFFVKGYTEDDLRIKCNELYHKEREINKYLDEITSTFYVDLGVNEGTTFADLEQKERDICKSITAVKEPYEKKKITIEQTINERNARIDKEEKEKAAKRARLEKRLADKQKRLEAKIKDEAKSSTSRGDPEHTPEMASNAGGGAVRFA